MGEALFALYVFGFAITWFVAARFWTRRYRSKRFELIEAGVWGMLVAVFWPIAGIGWLIGKAAASL